MSARCATVTGHGMTCREQRLPWLWLVEEDGRLRYRCTRHLDRSNPYRVSAVAMRQFLIDGGGAR